MKYQHPIFSREEPEALYDDLRSLPQLVKIAVHQAMGSGPAKDAADRLDLAEVQRIARVAVMHLQAARERAIARDNAMEKALAAAETRARSALAGVAGDQIGDSFDPHGFFVYCLWGDDATTPLYVGMSTNVLARLGSHLGERGKQHQIRRVTLIRCNTYRQMDKTERRLITEYQPPLNTRGIRLDRELAASSK